MAAKTSPPSRRKLIKGNALRVFRRKRADMDQGVLRKIKEIIFNHPFLRKQLGIKEKNQEPSSQAHQADDHGQVTIDKAHNMEVLSKLMAINPESQTAIKQAMKQNKD